MRNGCQTGLLLLPTLEFCEDTKKLMDRNETVFFMFSDGKWYNGWTMFDII